jgi:RNA polymerase sigma-70 factor (ECF subfamily)
MGPSVRCTGVGGEADAERLTVAVEEARGGDETAFRELYRALQPSLLRYLRGLIGEDAEDVASEAWLQIARDLRGFSGDFGQFRGWAVTIARHRAIDHARHRRRRPHTPIDVEELADRPDPADTAAAASDAIATHDAIRLIAMLPRDQAEAVLLRVVVGLDAAAAGRILGKRPGAVRTAAHRGLRRLAELVERDAFRSSDAE